MFWLYLLSPIDLQIDKKKIASSIMPPVSKGKTSFLYTMHPKEMHPSETNQHVKVLVFFIPEMVL